MAESTQPIEALEPLPRCLNSHFAKNQRANSNLGVPSFKNPGRFRSGVNAIMPLLLIIPIASYVYSFRKVALKK